MDGKKIYQIQINGIKESIDAVEELNQKLQALDKRISEMSSKTVNVTTRSSGGGGGSSTNASLTEEVALQKELNALNNEGTKLEAKQAAYQDESYQKVLAQKDVLKEIVNDQKAIAAQERLQANVYAENTMAGMKAKLADIKQVMQTVDLGDTEQFTKLTQEADKLNSKLLEIEKSYGQFGRNVGNYANGVAEGLQKVKINVGGTVREFSSAREASRTLNNELKAMAINGDTTSDEFKQLREVVMQLESTMNDAKKPMDDLMDAMESFTAVASVSNGFAAFFGVDDSEIQKSIQRLLGLQTALKGIQTINKQIETREGLGKWIAPFTTSIDTSTKKALVFNRALLGTGKAAKVAAVSINVFSKALKLAFSAGVFIAIELIIDTVMNLVDAFKKEGEEAEEASKKVQEAVSKQRETYTQASAQYMSVASRLSHLRTEYAKTNDVMKKTSIIKQAAEEFKKVGINVKNINDAQRLFVNNGSEVIEMIKLQGDAAAIAALRMEAFMKSYRMLIENGYGASGAASLAGNSGEVQELDKLLDNVQTKISEHQKKLGIITDKGNAKEKKSVEDAQKELNRIKIELMKEGLNKTIKQLEEERKARLAKLNANSRNYKELEANINKLYDKKIEDATKEHADKVKETYKQLYDSIISYQLEYLKKYDKLNETAMQNSQGKLGLDLQKNLLSQRIGSYGIQGKNQYSPSTQKSLGIVSTVDDKMVDDLKKLIEVRREYEKVSTEAGLKALTRDEELKESKEALKKAEEEYTKFYIELEGERINMSDEEYEKRRDNILKRRKDLDEELAIIKEAYGEESDLAKQMLADISAEEAKLAKELTKLEGKKTLMSKEAYEETLRYNSQLVENERKTQEARIEILNQQTYDAKLLADEKLRVFEEEKKKFNELYSSEEDRQKASFTLQKLEEENYSKSLKDLFEQRLTAIEAYWLARNANEKQFIDRNYENQLKINQARHDLEISAEDKRWNELVVLNDKWRENERESVLADLNQRTITKEKADKQLNAIDKKYYEQGEKLSITHKNNIDAINAQLTKDQDAALIERNEKLKGYNAEYFEETLQEFRDFQTALTNLESKQPVMNIWGIVNRKQTNKNNRELLSAYESLATQLGEKRTKLNQEYKEGVIDKNVYESTLRELDSFAADLGDKIDKVKHELSFAGAWEQLSEGINQWVQMVGQAANQILSSLSEITQNQYQAQIDEQQKYIEKYEEMLDEQKEITQKYADDVNNIEDELKTARGDRRQQLIDNLNAEMAAQRASFAQEKKIEKEKEKAEDRKKTLEHDQAVAKKRMDLAQAYINAAMAVSMAAVNKWPIPAIPMMALAAAAGAAQIAAVASQNIPSYGDGGVIQGKSHAQGGVKVLGGYAEVEGNEYITNKVTTSKNVELLDFINSKKKRINLDDMIEFYGGNVRKSVSSASPKYKFAEGGVIPTLRNDIDINDRLLNVMEDYANRQVVVSVVDINDRQAAVREVEVLSGLNNE